jgi:hypothetical protein
LNAEAFPFLSLQEKGHAIYGFLINDICHQNCGRKEWLIRDGF